VERPSNPGAATPLTAAHRAWRRKVFAATWLSYVGFYFCRKPFAATKGALGKETGWDATTLGNLWAAYLIAYAVGQFLASGMGPKLGPRRNVLLGMAVSIAVTFAMGVTLSLPILAGLIAVNGLAQATGWSGNAGTMAGWFHRHERGRVMGLWSTNFIVGAIASGWVMSWVLSRHAPGEPEPWRACYFVGVGVLAVVWLQFFFLQRNRPEDVGLTPVDDPVTPVDESLGEPVPTGFLGLPRSAWTSVLLVGGFYFFSKFIRYAVWSWSAYFLEDHYGLSGSKANLYSTFFDLMGIPGVLITGWLSDRYFKSRRSGVALLMLFGMTAATGLLVVLGDRSVATFAVLLGLVGFFLFGPDALLTGAGAIDIGGRHRATATVAMIAVFGALGPVVQELVIARLYDAGDMAPVFATLFGSAAMASAFCVALVWRGRRSADGV
jgi:sugar phosphate permease